MFDALLETAREKISLMPDSKDRREGVRILKKADCAHFDSNFLVQILERTTDKELPIITSTRVFFTKRLQTALDLLTDVTDSKINGVDGFAKISLLYFCIDELLAAFHLAQHSFINQAFTHIRTVMEALDKVELFNQFPEWAALWSSEDPKDKIKAIFELSPKGVRKKLGKNKYDPLYSMFSELGPHGTFTGIRARTAQKISDKDNESRQLKLWIGGCPLLHNIVWVDCFLIYTLVMFILKITSIYEQHLNEEEVGTILSELQVEFKDFTLNHLVSWLQEEGLDPEPIIQCLESYQ